MSARFSTDAGLDLFSAEHDTPWAGPRPFGWSLSVATLLPALLLALGSPAVAQTKARAKAPSKASASSGSMLVPGDDASTPPRLWLEVGHPGLSASLLFGASPGVELGARASVFYAVEGLVSPFDVGVTELKLQALVRVRLLDGERMSIGLRFEPGPLVALYGTPQVGVALPVALDIVGRFGERFELGGSLELPLWITFGVNAQAVLPAQLGWTAVYEVAEGLSLTLKTRVGPAASLSTSRGSRVAISAQAGLAVSL